jgi:hypothetical protein
MVEEEKYIKLVEELRGIDYVKFFGVYKMDDITDRWSLLFGLTGVKNLDKRQKVFDRILLLIKKHLTKNDMQDIARIGLFSTTEHIIKDLMRFPDNIRVISTKANGNYIHDGYTFISKNYRAKK